MLYRFIGSHAVLVRMDDYSGHYPDRLFWGCSGLVDENISHGKIAL
jgi:hypothetical protein